MLRSPDQIERVGIHHFQRARTQLQELRHRIAHIFQAVKMNQGRERRAGLFDQSNCRFTKEAKRALATDEEFWKIEAALCHPINETEEVVATTVLADHWTFLRDQRGMVL